MADHDHEHPEHGVEPTAELAELVRLTGFTDEIDCHACRWQLYQAGHADLDLLRGALAAERDVPLLRSVVIAVLPLVDDHEPWLALLPGQDDYALRRSREVRILHRAAHLTPDEIDVPAWSDWLQLKLAEIPEPGLLRALAEKGRTKRIRRNAGTTLRGR